MEQDATLCRQPTEFSAVEQRIQGPSNGRPAPAKLPDESSGFPGRGRRGASTERRRSRAGFPAGRSRRSGTPGTRRTPGNPPRATRRRGRSRSAVPAREGSGAPPRGSAGGPGRRGGPRRRREPCARGRAVRRGRGSAGAASDRRGSRLRGSSAGRPARARGHAAGTRARERRGRRRSAGGRSDGTRCPSIPIAAARAACS